METLEGLEETEQLQQARSDSDISENQEERLVREFCGLEVREQKMREELSTEWKDLRKRLGNLICRIDGQAASLSAEEKRMEERRDESYWNGVQDLYEAVKAVVAAIEDDGMTSHDVLKYFGTSHALNALSKTDPRTIMERINEWKDDKERAPKEEKKFNIWEEFQVGDEVELESGCVGEPRKGIITGIIDANLLNLVYRLSDDGELYSCRVVGKRYKKTGRHFDSIPFMYGYGGK